MPKQYTPEEFKTYADGLCAAMCIGTMPVCVIDYCKYGEGIDACMSQQHLDTNNTLEYSSFAQLWRSIDCVSYLWIWNPRVYES